jgi:hypothetical protein
VQRRLQKRNVDEAASAVQGLGWQACFVESVTTVVKQEGCKVLGYLFGASKQGTATFETVCVATEPLLQGTELNKHREALKGEVAI